MSNRFITVLRQSGGRVLITGGFVIGVLVLIGLVGNSVNFEETFKGLPFSSNPDARLHEGPLGFLALGALLICIGCPRQVVSFFAAYFFGLWTGLVTALAATVVACMLSYGVARLFKATFKTFVRGKLDVAVRFWAENAFFASVIWRFLPAGSNLLTNFAAGALGIPALGFFFGSAVGYIPQTAVFAIVGSGIKVESGLQIGISVGLFVLSSLMGLALYARYRHKLRARSED